MHVWMVKKEKEKRVFMASLLSNHRKQVRCLVELNFRSLCDKSWISDKLSKYILVVIPHRLQVWLSLSRDLISFECCLCQQGGHNRQF